MLLSTVSLLTIASYAVCEPSVIIIGAGASGIAAATSLLKNGFTNVTVLEAEDRIGGRIFSVELDNGYVDLGAEWCNGEKGNVVYDMVKDLNVLRTGLTGYSQFYHSELKKISRNFSDALMQAFIDIYINPEKTNESLGEYLIRRYSEVIKRWEDDASKYMLAQQAVDWFESYVVTYKGAFTWFDVATNNDYLECDGNYLLNWNGLGSKTILNIMMGKYPDPSKALPIDDKILVNKTVTEIYWNGKKTMVKCADESSYLTDHVVVTVPLGVLKHDHDTMFIPKLPVDKVQAVNQLGYAAIHKVLLHFPRSWWNPTDIFSFIWTNATQSPSFGGPVKEKRSWVTFLSAITAIPHSPNVLEAWFTGSLIPDIEQSPDKVIVAGVMYALTHFGIVDSKVLVPPDVVARSKWYTNPHFRGTYSFQTPRSRRGENSDEIILSRPLGSDAKKPSLLFAGEATNPTHYATVHGAIETGLREADRIIKMYKK